MRLPSFYDFEALNLVKAQMGIPRDVYGSLEVKVDPGRLSEHELEILTNGVGIDVNFDQLTILADGTLAYRNSRVLLHIRDIHASGNDQNLPRYHLYNCSTLIGMIEKNRFTRYVISTTSNGIFSIRIMDGNRLQPKQTRLDVCRNCLNELRLNGYDSHMLRKKEKDKIVASFLPDHFFAHYPRSLFVQTPTCDSDTAPSNIYSDDWQQISLSARKEAGWCCEECRINLSDEHMRKYLQTHHKNGQRHDNGRENLMVLCIQCHARQPNHQHLRSHRDYIFFVRSVRPSLRG